MFSSAFSRIGDAHPASRFSHSDMVALSAASVRGPEPDSGHFIPSTPNWNCDVPQARMDSRPPAWTEVPWPRRVLGVEGDDTMRFNMKTPRIPKPYVTMPYRTYATQNNGPKKNSRRGSRTNASRHVCSRRHSVQLCQQSKIKSTTFGNKNLDDISGNQLVALILKELNIKTLPNHHAVPKNGWTIEEKLRRQRDSERLARIRIQAALDKHAAEIFEAAGENVFQHLKSTTDFSTALQFKIRISRIVDDLEIKAKKPRIRSRQLRRRAYAMMASSQPESIPEPLESEETETAPPARDQEPDGLHPERGPDLEPQPPEDDAENASVESVTPNQPDTSDQVEAVSEATTSSNVVTLNTETPLQPESQGVEETKEDEITSAIKSLQEQMNRQAGAIEDLMMSWYSNDQDVSRSFETGTHSGSRSTPHTGTLRNRNVTERHHHHADQTTVEFEPLPEEESDSQDSDSESESHYSYSDSDDLSIPSLSNMSYIAQSMSTPGNSSPTGPSI